MAALSQHWYKKYSGGGSCLPSLFALSTDIMAIHSTHFLKTSCTADHKLWKVMYCIANGPVQQSMKSVGYMI